MVTIDVHYFGKNLKSTQWNQTRFTNVSGKERCLD